MELELRNKILKGCLAFVITLTVLYIGQFVWQSYAVAQPVDKALQSITGVEKVVLQNHQNLKNPVTISITLNNITNLQKTYSEINQRVIDAIDNKPYKLEIKDTRTTELEALYYDIHYYSQAAIVNGSFPTLADKTQEKAHAAGVTARVYVDEQYVYVQLTKNSHSLYAIEPRNLGRTGGSK